MSFKLPFQKMHGAGNDFVMVSGRDLNGLQLDTQLIEQLCDRRTGIGADGLIVVGEALTSKTAFRMIYFNADGGEAEMCGNGARCTVDFAARAGLFQGSCTFDTYSGVLTGEILEPGLVKVSLPAWKDLELEHNISGTPWTVQHSCNTGVPHVVILVDDVGKVDIKKWGAYLRYHEKFAPAGTNINWVSRDPDSTAFRIRTYERGVEDETLACGTGASASAVVLCHLNEATSPVSLKTRGGDILTVSVDPSCNGLHLQGPAVTSFKGEVEIDG